MNTSKLGKFVWQGTIAVLVAILLWLLWKGLFVAQPMTVVENHQGQTFPAFTLAKINDVNSQITLKDLQGKPHLVHIFASWCGVCMEEHATWMTIKNKYPYPIVGVVYRDEEEPVKELLAKKGDPFIYVLNDMDGKLGLDLGLMGVPETYVLDAKGKVRMHQLGAISLAQFEAEIAPLLDNLSKES
ncbi:MAG: redoxin family protein [Candidatus Berkiella sp.]